MAKSQPALNPTLQLFPLPRRQKISNPVLDLDFPDPSVLLWDGLAYAFATNSRGIHIQAACSQDLRQWSSPWEALPHLPPWAVQRFGWSWSPCVRYSPTLQQFVMYYVARLEDGNAGVQAIGVALSNEPGGPYCPVESGPLICQEAEGGSIDPQVYEEAGRRYLLWKSDGNSRGLPIWIYLQELSPDGLELCGSPARLITTGQDWEGSVIEGPCLVKHNGCYVLFYSANAYTTRQYAIGVAISERLDAAYRKCPQPLLASGGEYGLVGPGGQDVVTLEDGRDQGRFAMLFHSWSPGRYRQMNLAYLDWDDDLPVACFDLWEAGSQEQSYA